MEDSNTLPAPRPPLMARVYGVRTLYQPAFRLMVLRFAAVLACGLYLARAAAQFAGLPRASLQWDFHQFFQAAQALATGHDPYAAFLHGCTAGHWCRGGYIFPPLLAGVMLPLTSLSEHTAAAVWLLLSHVFFFGAVLVTVRALRTFVPQHLGLLVLAGTFMFLPVYVSLYFLQVGMLLLLLLSLSAAAYIRKSERSAAVAGAWLGVAAVLRVSPVLAAPMLLFPGRLPRRGRRAVAGLLGAAVLLLGTLELLTPYTLEYFTHVLPRIGGGTSQLDNQSLPGILARGLELWGLAAPPPVLTGLLFTAALLLPSWVTARRAAASAYGPRVAAATFAIFLAAMPIVSSITWQHHLVTQVLVYALALPLLVVTARPLRTYAGWLMAASYPLMLADRHMTDPIALGLGLGQPSGWRVLPFLVVTGVNLLGMVCLWSALLLLLSGAGRHRLDDEAAAA
jgi:hypothetical protein